ncbi:MAG: DUF4256 domain-containing protein [Saprospiraceae bacterium]|nr:DUF4256 domain-containing protein [Saprospiraceae bacterium]
MIKSLTPKQSESLLSILKSRFEKNMQRHKELEWTKLEAKLKSQSDKLWSLYQMEETGGEPDVIGHNQKSDEYIFFDCSEESPKGRRSFCYDRKALDSRKANKPSDNAMELAEVMGIRILTEEEYRVLQTIGEFDLKTSSWILTPDAIRNLGGALFGDRRFNHVFIYHNGAESYYAARGFRGVLKV